MPTSTSSVTINLSAEELAGLRHLLSTQQTKKRKDREGDSTLDMNQMHGHDSNSNSNGYDDKTSWIGVTIKAPAGERGRGTNAGGRLGFKTEDILKQACITAGQWSQYMSTAHRLIDHYFDITKNWTTNSQTNPDAWKLIVSEMQAHHPRFLFHEGNWLIRHLAISHLTNMNRKFRKMEDDPDLEVYHAFLAKKTAIPCSMHVGRPISKGLHKEAPAPAPLACKRTDIPECVPPSRKSVPTSSHVLNVPTNSTSPQKSVSSLCSVNLLIDSEIETNFDLSDVCDNQPPKKKQKRDTRSGVPVEAPAHQSQHQTLRAPLHPLNTSAITPTSKQPPAASTRPRRGNGTHLEQNTKGSRVKPKAKVLLAGSDTEEGIPPPRPRRLRRHVDNPRNPHTSSPR